MKNINKFIEEESYTKPTKLCKIMNECGSDKGNGHHNYTTLYNFLWVDIKDDVKNIFEVGIGSTNPGFTHGMGPDGTIAASLYGWEKYFKNCDIYSCDIDTDCLVKTDKIKTFLCDQTDGVAVKELISNINKDFDIIIDDGLHEFHANKIFLDNSIHSLKSGGYYIIEDINMKTKHYNEAKQFVKENKNNYEYIEMIDLPNPGKNEVDNSIIVIKK